MGDIENAPIADVTAIVERYVAALPRDEGDGVKNFVHEIINKRVERHEQRVDQLKSEIERLKQLRAVVPRDLQSHTYALPPFMPYWPRGGYEARQRS
jgi:hypothetical protein